MIAVSTPDFAVSTIIVIEYACTNAVVTLMETGNLKMKADSRSGKFVHVKFYAYVDSSCHY